MTHLFESIIGVLVAFILQVGYVGIFFGMFLESTMVPLPSELIMIPAGMAAAKGSMNLYMVAIVGIVGNVFGAVFMYYLSDLIGRPILFKVGRYFFIKPETVIKMENFFQNHGSISVFIGRLIPGMRHFISIPAGIAKMNFKLFFLYTFLGSTIWTSLLVMLGFIIGENQELIKKNLHEIVTLCATFCVLVVAFYILYGQVKKFFKKKA